MKKQKNIELDRRSFFGAIGFSMFASQLVKGKNLFVLREHKDEATGHGMLLFGERSIYLSHLPMFGTLNEDKSVYTSPHRYQVILEIVFKDKNDKEVQCLYSADRIKKPEENIYTINPTQSFILPEISQRETPKNTRNRFPVDVFRGHFERSGHEMIPGLEGVTVEIKRVIHFQRFDPTEKRPENLEYILFGKPEEMFLAHYISRHDNFDQILSAKTTDMKFNLDELQKGIRLIVPDRQDLSMARLKEKQNVTARLKNKSDSKGVGLQAIREFYFEENELKLF